MAELDQTARMALKIDPAESLRWLVPELDPDLAFTRWLDTETIAFPGEPGRRCDTVAELVSHAGRSPPWALVLEVEARLRATISARLLEYVSRLLRKVRHGPHHRDKYQVAAILILLTGQKDDLTLEMRLPGTNLGLSWQVRVVSLAAQQATATLERIARGELGRSILPWVPLMAGAGDPAVVTEWARLAREEPDAERRTLYAVLALVFAERAGWLPAWKPSLEAMNVWESQVIKEWKNAGRTEGLREGQLEMRRTDLLRVMRIRYKTEIPADLAQTIQQTTDLDLLSRWFDAALEAPSLEAFRSAAQLPPASGG
jgi:hypothetical protein